MAYGGDGGTVHSITPLDLAKLRASSDPFLQKPPDLHDLLDDAARCLPPHHSRAERGSHIRGAGT